MDESQKQDIARLRAKGLSPKDIARALKLSPSAVTNVIRELAANAAAVAVPQVARCLVSRGWQRSVALKHGVEVAQPLRALVPVASTSVPELVQVVVAVERGDGMLDFSLFLLDPGCMGVKDVVVKRKYTPAEFKAFEGTLAENTGMVMEEVEVSTARQLVFGCVEYATSLGFPPPADFERAAAALGPRGLEPLVFQLGHQGKPCFVPGPHDDVAKVLRTLRNAVGEDGFTQLASRGR